MVEYTIINNETAVLAIIIGIALLVFVVLFYIDMWQQRKPAHENESENRWWKPIPWTLKITYIGSAVFAVIYTIYRIINPPNW
jgi:uncharacterized membrane protein YadS